MDTTKLKKFAQFARRNLMGLVSAKLDSVLAEGAAARREHPEAMKKLEAAIARVAELRDSASDSQALADAIKALDDVSRPFVERIMNRAVGTLLEGRRVDEV